MAAFIRRTQSVSRPRRRPMLAADMAQKPYGTADRRDRCDAPPGSVSKVEMTTPMALICKALFPSISTFETPPSFSPKHEAALHLSGLRVLLEASSARC